LAVRLAFLLERLRKQRALAIGMRETVFDSMVSIAKEKLKHDDAKDITWSDRKVRDRVYHVVNFYDAFQYPIRIGVHSGESDQLSSLYVRIHNRGSEVNGLTEIENIRITPISDDRGKLTIEYGRSLHNLRVQVSYHRGHEAALKQLMHVADAV
jgi:hypothetical protein